MDMVMVRSWGRASKLVGGIEDDSSGFLDFFFDLRFEAISALFI